MTIQSAFRSGETTRRDQYPIDRYKTPAEAFYKAVENDDGKLARLRAFTKKLFIASDSAFSVIEEQDDKSERLMCSLNDNPRIQFFVEAEINGAFIKTENTGSMPAMTQHHAVGDDGVQSTLEDLARWVGRNCDGSRSENIMKAIHRYTGNRDALKPNRSDVAVTHETDSNIVTLSFGN